MSTTRNTPSPEPIVSNGSASQETDPQGPVPALSPPNGGRSPTRPSTSAVCALVMRKLGTRAARVFLHLVDGLAPGEGRRFDNAGRGFTPVSVDCLTRERVGADGADVGALYAVAHRFESNGDLVPDPDVEFYVVADPTDALGRAVYPTAIDHPPPFGYRRYVDFGSDGIPEAVNRRGQADLSRFCDGWMKNIAHQQGLVLR